jgi:hypothetical protein
MPTREVDLKLVGGRLVTGGVLQAGVAIDGGTIMAVARDDLAAWTDRSPHLLEAQHVRA